MNLRGGRCRVDRRRARRSHGRGLRADRWGVRRESDDGGGLAVPGLTPHGGAEIGLARLAAELRLAAEPCLVARLCSADSSRAGARGLACRRAGLAARIVRLRESRPGRVDHPRDDGQVRGRCRSRRRSRSRCRRLGAGRCPEGRAERDRVVADCGIADRGIADWGEGYGRDGLVGASVMVSATRCGLGVEGLAGDRLAGNGLAGRGMKRPGSRGLRGYGVGRDTLRSNRLAGGEPGRTDVGGGPLGGQRRCREGRDDLGRINRSPGGGDCLGRGRPGRWREGWHRWKGWHRRNGWQRRGRTWLCPEPDGTALGRVSLRRIRRALHRLHLTGRGAAVDHVRTQRRGEDALGRRGPRDGLSGSRG
jgi:hypothetical protein